VTSIKIQTSAILLLTAFTGLAAMQSAVAQEPKKEANAITQSIQGKWAVASLTIDGVELPKALRGVSSVVFKGDVMTQKPEVFREGGVGQASTLKLGDGEFPVTFQLDAAKNPKHFNVVIDAGLMKIQAPGIFHLESKGAGDKLKICYHPSQRPTDFTSKADSGNILLVLTRSKK
jgi:uncharacterized protein (TIGR03067 family)